jgi:hypothetical protein
MRTLRMTPQPKNQRFRPPLPVGREDRGEVATYRTFLRKTYLT